MRIEKEQQRMYDNCSNIKTKEYNFINNLSI